MKAILSAAILFLATSVTFAVVTKEDVQKLLIAGISEDTIVEYIHRNAPAAPMTTEDLTELKAAGASDRVLTALLDASQASGSSDSSGSTYAAPDSAPTYSDDPSYGYYDYSYPYYSYSYPYYYPYFYPFFSLNFSNAHFHDHVHDFHHDQFHNDHFHHPVTAPPHTAPQGGVGTFRGHR
jgi:hypothetical protein